MITVNGRILNIPKEDEFVGFVGDNKIETRTFEITDKTLFDFDFKLDLRSMLGKVGIIDLLKTVEADRVILTWVIQKEHLFSGPIHIQLRAFDDVEKWHSNVCELQVGNSINATEYFPSLLPSEFEQMEKRVTDMQTDVAAKSNQVMQDKIDVATNKQIAIEKAVEALQSAANALASEQATKQSETNAKDSETSAFDSMQTAVQAMTDLLNMMGADIATLTGGKLTPSQIPAIAITDTFVVDNESAMLALTAEIGDVCIRTDESKSYILQGTDPSVLGHWQHLQTPTNYADAAGHATTADEAINSNMINGHRIVTMSESQYANAVVDEDTVYLVFPD